MLDEMGVKGVRALLGGYGAWVSAGYPVAQGDQPR
jgi:3-mercaptopyruvate sulfurtransferase SseA